MVILKMKYYKGKVDMTDSYISLKGKTAVITGAGQAEKNWHQCKSV